MIQIIGAPFDGCGLRYGSRLGPAALRLAGLTQALQALAYQVHDAGDVPTECDRAGEDGLRNFEPMLEAITEVKSKVASAIANDAVPLVIGGEHSIAMGGLAAAVDAYGEQLAVLWIDAHADLNTPASSSTGNIHGMPLAALLGLPSGVEGSADAQWRQLLSLVSGGLRLSPARLSFFGLRDVDPAEREFIREHPECLALTMHDIDRRGLVHELQRFHEWMKAAGATELWISFDVDALDPILAPGTGTAVRGGLTYREAHLCAEVLRELLDAPDCTYRLAGVDLVEANPLFDTNNETAKMAVEWIASLFGKTILGRR